MRRGLAFGCSACRFAIVQIGRKSILARNRRDAARDAAFEIGIERLRREVPVRFDVVSVYLLADDVEFEVYKGAFGWVSPMQRAVR